MIVTFEGLTGNCAVLSRFKYCRIYAFSVLILLVQKCACANFYAFCMSGWVARPFCYKVFDLMYAVMGKSIKCIRCKLETQFPSFVKCLGFFGCLIVIRCCCAENKTLIYQRLKEDLSCPIVRGALKQRKMLEFGIWPGREQVSHNHTRLLPWKLFIVFDMRIWTRRST